MNNYDIPVESVGSYYVFYCRIYQSGMAVKDDLSCMLTAMVRNRFRIDYVCVYVITGSCTSSQIIAKSMLHTTCRPMF